VKTLVLPRFPRLIALLSALALGGALAAPPADGGPPNPNAAEAPKAAASQPAPAGLQRFLQQQGWIGPPAEGDTPGPAEEGTWLSGVRDGAGALVRKAMGFLGVPYVRGGNNSEQGFDCSGFTRYVFEHSLGFVLPRRADEQAQSDRLLSIDRAELKPGDLVFFNTMRRTFSHVGIYLGDGKFIHAPRAGAVVRVEDMRDAYWSRRFTGARRAQQPAS
jgi:cell wall-associated NlpC family hydrolase